VWQRGTLRILRLLMGEAGWRELIVTMPKLRVGMPPVLLLPTYLRAWLGRNPLTGQGADRWRGEMGVLICSQLRIRGDIFGCLVRVM